MELFLKNLYMGVLELVYRSCLQNSETLFLASSQEKSKFATGYIELKQVVLVMQLCHAHYSTRNKKWLWYWWKKVIYQGGTSKGLDRKPSKIKTDLLSKRDNVTIVILKVIKCSYMCILSKYCYWANSRHYRLQYKQGSYMRLLQDFM